MIMASRLAQGKHIRLKPRHGTISEPLSFEGVDLLTERILMDPTQAEFQTDTPFSGITILTQEQDLDVGEQPTIADPSPPVISYARRPKSPTEIEPHASNNSNPTYTYCHFPYHYLFVSVVLAICLAIALFSILTTFYFPI